MICYDLETIYLERDQLLTASMFNANVISRSRNKLGAVFAGHYR